MSPLIKENKDLRKKYLWWKLVKSSNCISIGTPNDTNCVAYKAGLKTSEILLKYNNWEIGDRNYLQLSDEINSSKEKNKIFIFLNMEDLSIEEYHLPQGVVGILFRPEDGNDGRYEIAIEKFKEWQQQHLEE